MVRRVKYLQIAIEVNLKVHHLVDAVKVKAESDINSFGYCICYNWP